MDCFVPDKQKTTSCGEQRTLGMARCAQWNTARNRVGSDPVCHLYKHPTRSSEKLRHIYLSADDTNIFRAILNDNDCEKLQEDINAVVDWSNNSLLKFNPDKCTSMRIVRSNAKAIIYAMGPDKHPLRKYTKEKDIGVIIDHNIPFATHIQAKINKANSIMEVIRITYIYINEEAFLRLYKSLVRPHIEYAHQVWAPHLKKHKPAIENVQRRATKLIAGFKDLTHEYRLRRLNLTTLAYRRLRGDTIEMHRIATGRYDPEVSDVIKTNTRKEVDSTPKILVRPQFSRHVEQPTAVRCLGTESRSFEGRLDKINQYNLTI